ncbi:MAG: hypothetical protein AABM30_03380 [Actinomycetota bacterium]
MAYFVLGLCAAGVILFSSLAIWLDTTTRAETTRLVFVSVLPLFGTWVGLVLAYYYGSKNLAAATRSTETLSGVAGQLAGIATAATLVREKMIPDTKIESLSLTPDEDKNFEQLPLRRLWDRFEEIKPLGYDRLPILGPDKTIRGLMHRSLLDRFAAGQAGKLPDALEGKNISNLSTDERRLLSTYAFVPVSANLGDARRAMKSVPDCNDVLVTETGVASEPIKGWLTNSELAELSD